MSDFDGVIDPAAGWPDVPQLSTDAVALGGATGPMNAQALALAARTRHLLNKFNEVPNLDADGKLPVSMLPSVAITDVFPVASQAAMLALNAQPGDVAIRSDVGKTFILMASPASTLGNWKELINDAVQKLLSSTIDVGLVPKFDNTSGVPTLNVPDNPGKRLFINKECSSPDDYTVMQIARHAKYSGGTAGFVGTAFQAKTHVEATAIGTSEWAGLFQIDNHAPNNPAGGGPGNGALPQNVALYGQAQKRNTGSTWSLCTEINDYSSTGTGAAIGHELTCAANGPDNATNPQRNSSHVAIGKLVSGGEDVEWGRGYWVSTGAGAWVRYSFDNSAAVGDSVFHNKGSSVSAKAALLRDEGSLVEGINTAAATYSSGRAITLGLYQRIALEPTDQINISAAPDGMVLRGNVNIADKLAFSSSKTQLTATAGDTATLPARPARFLQIIIDGSPFVIPVYGA